MSSFYVIGQNGLEIEFACYTGEKPPQIGDKFQNNVGNSPQPGASSHELTIIKVFDGTAGKQMEGLVGLLGFHKVWYIFRTKTIEHATA